MYNFYPKLIYKLHAIPKKTLTHLLIKPGNWILEFIWRKTKNSQDTPKNKQGRWSLSDQALGFVMQL